MPMGTPPKGRETSAAAAAARAASASTWLKALSVRGVDGGQGGVEGLGRGEGPGPEGVDQGAGIVRPGLIGHGRRRYRPRRSRWEPARRSRSGRSSAVSSVGEP